MLENIKENSIIIPKSAFLYILLQRTRLQKFQKIVKITRLPYFPFFCWLDLLFYKKRIAREYCLLMEEEYRIYKPFLPTSALAVLDIGCGVAGIDVLIHRHLGCPTNTEYYLLDRTGMSDTIHYGFEQSGAYYNNLHIAEQLMVANGIAAQQVHTISVDKTPEPKLPKLDLVISLRAWGFHFPISTYLAMVWERLNPNGILLIDIRLSMDSEKSLSDIGFNVQPVLKMRKFIRLACTKPE